MRARIYQPARNAMTSGQARTKKWVLEFAPEGAREIDPLMGWTRRRSRSASRRKRRRWPMPRSMASWRRSSNLTSASPTSAPVAMARTSRRTVARPGHTDRTAPQPQPQRLIASQIREVLPPADVLRTKEARAAVSRSGTCAPQPRTHVAFRRAANARRPGSWLVSPPGTAP